MNEFVRLNSELEKQCHILREMLQTFPIEAKASEVTSDYVKAGAITSRLRNGRPEKTNSKERTSTFRRRVMRRQNCARIT